MANVYLKDSTLTSIGDAIRSKNGTTTKYKPSEMPAAITAISGGGTPVAKKRFKIENPITLSPGNAYQTGPVWGTTSAAAGNGLRVVTPAVHEGDAFVGIWFAPNDHEDDMAVIVDTVDSDYSPNPRDSRKPNSYPDQFTYYKATQGHPNTDRYLRACFSANLDYFAHASNGVSSVDDYKHGFFLGLSYTSSNGGSGRVQAIPLLVRGGATALSAPKQVLLGPNYDTLSYTTTQDNEIVCIISNILLAEDTYISTPREIYTDKLDTNIWYNGNGSNYIKRLGVVYAPTAGTKVTFSDQVYLNNQTTPAPEPNDVQFFSMTLS